jgi:hypothetical protein
MKHLTFADKSLLVGDDVADLIVEYAAMLARAGDADTVDVAAYGADGDAVHAKLLLAEGAPLMAETSHTDLPEPDNSETLMYVREQMMRRSSPPSVQPADATMPANYEDLEL